MFAAEEFNLNSITINLPLKFALELTEGWFTLIIFNHISIFMLYIYIYVIKAYKL